MRIKNKTLIFDSTNKNKDKMKTNRAKMQRRFKAMTLKAIELGFNTIREAENAGYSNQLKLAYENAN